MDFTKISLIVFLTASLNTFLLSMQDENKDNNQNWSIPVEINPFLSRLPQEEVDELIYICKKKEEEEKQNNETKTS